MEAPQESCPEDTNESIMDVMFGTNSPVKEDGSYVSAQSDQNVDTSSSKSEGTSKSDMESSHSAVDDEMFLTITEDHFSEMAFNPDTWHSESQDCDYIDLPVDKHNIEREIKRCLKYIRLEGVTEEQKKHLIHKLCQLRIRLNQMNESNQEKYLNGHRFVPQTSPSFQPSACDICLKKQPLLSTFFNKSFLNTNPIKSCQYCDFKIHEKCLVSVLGHHYFHENFMTNVYRVRKCPSTWFDVIQPDQVGQDPVNVKNKSIIYQICPEIGLAKQMFKCNDCGIRITFNDSRIDDYDGRYYCHTCHWNDMSCIPSRIIHNWDPELYPVSRKSLQVIHFIRTHVILFDLLSLNSMLFGLIPELPVIKRIRIELHQMVSYIRCCHQPSKPNLSHVKPHLLSETTLNCYSLDDLTNFDSLQKSLQELKLKLSNHITIECQGCRGKGYFCTICHDKKEILFPFSPNIASCLVCSNVYHKTCFQRKHKQCPRCVRQTKELEQPPVENTKSPEKEEQESEPKLEDAECQSAQLEENPSDG